MPRALKLLGAFAALLLLLAGAALLWIRTRSGEEVAERVTSKLEAALGGQCRIGEAKLLSPRKVTLANVACTLDEGPVVGFAAVHVEVELDGAALRSLPPIREAVVSGMHVKLRRLPTDAEPDGDDDSAPADASLSGIAESLAERFVRAHGWVDGRPGAAPSAALLARIADGGVVRLERVTIEMDELPADLPLPTELSAQVTRAGEALQLGLVATLPGGTVRATAETSGDGLASGELQLDAIDLLPLLRRTDAFDVRAASLSGSVRFAAGAPSWPVSLSLAGLTVSHPFLGATPALLPTLGGRGELALSDDGMVLREGAWQVASQEGALDARLGPLDGAPALQLRAAGERLHLGQLLAALPESMLPDDWAREIQGTMDVSLAFGGPLHDRSTWTLDWDADFSRMVLADGELAAQVRRLHGPFSHTIPATSEGAVARQRTIGPSDPHFVAYADISPWLTAAVVSTEDAGFFGHSGFEVSEIKEALLDNLRAGEGRGGSTITQQLAKNLFLSGERTMSRKLKEAVIAWRLESDLPKERILEIYLNIAEWGPGIYGIRDAADHYFARTPKVLKPEEAAFLASLLPSPRRYHGYYHGRNRGLTKNRQDRVEQILATMLRLGKLDARQHQLARIAGVELAPCGLSGP